jgi:hypothetical protein
MRLRSATDLPVGVCQKLHSQLPEVDRERIVLEYENGRKFQPWFRATDAPEQIRDLSGWGVV